MGASERLQLEAAETADPYGAYPRLSREQFDLLWY